MNWMAGTLNGLSDLNTGPFTGKTRADAELKPGRNEAFDQFGCRKIALYDEAKIEELMKNEKIIRNRLKIKSAITNAQQFIKIQEEYGSFDSFLWSYVGGKPVNNHFQSEDEVPAKAPLSDKISKDLKKHGFKFVGSTIVYAYMQAVGLVNDHVKTCYLYKS